MDVLIFLLALSVVVVFHELGHFWAAKKTGVKVEEFGLGIPPKIFGKKIGETIFSLNWLPIGGFCRLYGEDPTIKLKSQRAFCNKNVGQKTVIIMGGVMMNVVLAVLIFSVVYSIVGIPKETDRVKVIEVASGSPA
ncbi:site-2 protease family protein, partial [Patescibacteria group bacterium]|nr:site-2 protease family protein [Patescibacteria group bacterium]